MNKNQEELERIIRQFDYYHERSKSTDNLLKILTYTVGDDTDDFIEKFAQAILSAGYMKNNKVKELETVLDAWYSVFGTTQLTHALARLEFAEGELEKLKRNLKG